MMFNRNIFDEILRTVEMIRSANAMLTVSYLSSDDAGWKAAFFSGKAQRNWRSDDRVVNAIAASARLNVVKRMLDYKFLRSLNSPALLNVFRRLRRKGKLNKVEVALLASRIVGEGTRREPPLEYLQFAEEIFCSKNEKAKTSAILFVGNLKNLKVGLIEDALKCIKSKTSASRVNCLGIAYCILTRPKLSREIKNLVLSKKFIAQVQRVARVDPDEVVRGNAAFFLAHISFKRLV